MQSKYGNSQKEIDIRAELGDADAQLVKYFTEKVTKVRLRWLCSAADQAQPVAQDRLGDLYRSGEEELSKNLVLSYVWYRRSAGEGFVPAHNALQNVQDSMSPDQILLAEQKYSSWSPGSCQSEVELHELSQ